MSDKKLAEISEKVSFEKNSRGTVAEKEDIPDSANERYLIQITAYKEYSTTLDIRS